MLSAHGRRIAIHVLPAAHLCLCTIAQLGVFPPPNEWGPWFIVFSVDFPASMLASRLDGVPPVAAYATVGTLWWYLLSAAALRFLGTQWRQTHGRGPG